MKTRRAIKGALAGFLGTYASRYSDHQGYWLFGMLVANLDRMESDLAGASPETPESTPAGVAKTPARRRFREQMAKARLSLGLVRSASLEISRQPTAGPVEVNGRVSLGYGVQFRVNVVTNTGSEYHAQCVALVAPHNPTIELRSARADSGA